MAASTTGSAMLRAGLPAGWAVGDKTGRWRATDRYPMAPPTISPSLTPPGRKPILVAAYTAGDMAMTRRRKAVLADIGRIIADRFCLDGETSRVQCDLGLQQLGDRAARLGLAGQLLELGLVAAGNFGSAR